MIELPKPIKKTHIEYFKKYSFIIPENFFNSGIFYVKKANLIANTSFGSNKINVRCQGSCESQIKEFKEILSEIWKI